ncbi:MAG: 4Fe-4S dicluster domain-containing protein [Thermoproteota archaeon]
MPLKTVKKDTPQQLTLEWKLHVKHYQLILTKDRCMGCQICSLACPKEAINLQKPEPSTGKTEPAKIDINLDKCNFCGICDVLCPYGAIRIMVDGENLLSILEKESFPRLIRDIQIHEENYPKDPLETGDICPLDLIFITPAPEKETTGHSTRSPEGETGYPVKIDIQEEYCPGCRVCEFKLPEGVITVRKIFHGKLTLYSEKCPEDCTRCLDVCPITGALYLDERAQSMQVNEMFCVYCGACQVVCPEEALKVIRTRIRHTPVNSGAWNKTLERVCSPRAVTKELKTKAYYNARKAVENRLRRRKT